MISNNRIFGNYQAGAGMLPQLILAGDKDKRYRDAARLQGNEIRGNHYGLGGADLNGRDIVLRRLGLQQLHLRDRHAERPAGRPLDVVGLPVRRDRTLFSQDTPEPAARPVRGRARTRAAWVKHPHKARKGYKPLETCIVTKNGCKGQPVTQ